MGKLRYYMALWTAKASIPVMKLTGHNATNYPGHIACKMCPDFLKYIGKPETIISVTGTNGKTSVNNMITDIFEASGKKVLSNRAGSNTRTGITTALINGATLMGKAKYDTAVFETDERSTLRIFPFGVTPKYVIITNLFRDSIMRNGHPEFIGNILSTYIPKESKLILCADDLIASQVAPDNERVYFGIDKLDSDIKECINLINDIRVCPKCFGRLEYDYLRYHHIGKAHCVDCGFSSPSYDYEATKVDYANKTVTISDKNGSGTYEMVNDAIFNIYNMVAITALFREMGYSHEEIAGYMKSAKVVESRFNEMHINGVDIITHLAKEKNALGISRTFDYVKDLPGKKSVLLMMNCLFDEMHWSENTCWMYDCDFEFLNSPDIEEIVVSGARALDYRLRLLFAGVPDEKIKICMDELEGARTIAMRPGMKVCIMHGVDSFALSLEAKKILKERAEALHE